MNNDERLFDELLSIGIEEEPMEEDGKYVIELSDEDQWGQYFSAFDGSDFRSDPEEDELDLFHSVYKFYSKDYTYELTSNFDTDEYKLVIDKRKDN